MTTILKQTYYRLIAPPIVGFILAGAAKTNGILAVQATPVTDMAARIIFFLTALCAVAVPILLRTLFVFRVRDKKTVSDDEFLAFELWFLYCSMPALYLALVAYALDFPGFYVTGSFLMALYAAYYYFPSQRRVALEKRIFRLS